MRRRAGAPTDKGEAFDRAFAILGDSGGGETRCKYSSRYVTEGCRDGLVNDVAFTKSLVCVCVYA